MELAAWLNYLPDLKKGSRAAPRPVQTPGCPSVSHCMSAFHACHRIFSVLCSALLTNSPSITGTSWLSARHLAKQQRVTSIGMRGIHPALGRQCSRAVTMGKKKIQSSNPGIPESRPRGSLSLILVAAFCSRLKFGHLQKKHPKNKKQKKSWQKCKC